jgi:hypothetical protein
VQRIGGQRDDAKDGNATYTGIRDEKSTPYPAVSRPYQWVSCTTMCSFVPTVGNFVLQGALLATKGEEIFPQRGLPSILPAWDPKDFHRRLPRGRLRLDGRRRSHSHSGTSEKERGGGSRVPP